MEYKNNPTVCCVLIPWENNDLVLIRRGLPDGYGKLALPGGFQNFGETMIETAVREVKEETGIDLSPDELRVVSAKTDEYGHNVIFFHYMGGVDYQKAFTHDDEILGVETVSEPVETAYPFHTEVVKWYFDWGI